jgi:hypothetical protein
VVDDELLERRIHSAEISGGHGYCHAEILRSGRSLTLQKKRNPLKQAGKLDGASLDAHNFSAVQEHCPPEKLTTRHSLLATRRRFSYSVHLKSVSTKQSLLKQAN